MATYMILMRENDNAWSSYPPDEQQRLLQKYYGWVAELRESGASPD